MTSTTLRRGLAAVAVLSGLVVSGCGTHPGAAAVVDGQRISENEVARAIEDFTAVTGQPVDAPMMLGTLIVAPIMVEVAAQHGVAASDAEAAALLDEQAEFNDREAPDDYSQGVLQVATMTIVQQGLAQASDPEAWSTRSPSGSTVRTSRSARGTGPSIPAAARSPRSRCPGSPLPGSSGW